MHFNRIKKGFFIVVALIFATPIFGQESIARQWNDVLLEAIRNDFARPTVHARNLFHTSAAMYDAWAVFSDEAQPYLLGKEIHGFTSTFDGYSPVTNDIDVLRDKAISYAIYRLILYRFSNSPGAEETLQLTHDLFDEKGYDPGFISIDYSNGSAAALGNYIADQYISFGLLDGSNEVGEYENEFYEPVNQYLDADSAGNEHITDPNRWQPLRFVNFVDQSGNVIGATTPDFLGPEWGAVAPFSLKEADLTTYQRDGSDYQVYHDPGPPPYLDPDNGTGLSDLYKWGFSMVAVWSGHLDNTNNVLVDISPGAIGNIDIESLPQSFEDYDQFYDYLGGGDTGQGRTLNPSTGLPYTSQMVELGDYGRVLAEFWADGPDSETPPGHWFTLLNYVNDHPAFEKKFSGEGELVGNLEWDIKSYFIMGGAMHDVAITSWGIKGYYDYIRPISAIRFMADKGQSSDELLPNYDIQGIPLVQEHIELVQSGDPLVGSSNENLNKIKLKAWKGPDFISDPASDVAGVDWILAENWWPYQRPSFITPPFAGYISGHSTFSRAAAEIMTLLTGDEFFPGGIGEFDANQNEFLVFEDGPSQDIVLQWATYRDASDQCSLSRIWGGIHPPADDLPGRIIGEKIGIGAFEFGKSHFTSDVLGINQSSSIPKLYPNPSSDEITLLLPSESGKYTVEIFDFKGKKVFEEQFYVSNKIQLTIDQITTGTYLLKITGERWTSTQRFVKK